MSEFLQYYFPFALIVGYLFTMGSMIKRNRWPVSAQVACGLIAVVLAPLAALAIVYHLLKWLGNGFKFLWHKSKTERSDSNESR